MSKVITIDHPLVQHKLTRCRNKETEPWEFRSLVEDIAVLLIYEATRGLPVKDVTVETPVSGTTATMLDSPGPNFIAVLRAGLGMLSGAMRFFPGAGAGHIGLYRDPRTLKPVEYYIKLPGTLPEGDCYLLEPMLATGGSAVHAAGVLKRAGAARINLISLIASPEGVSEMQRHHPEVNIILASLDSGLNEKAYIVPGLGDAGDRLFGTN